MTTKPCNTDETPRDGRVRPKTSHTRQRSGRKRWMLVVTTLVAAGLPVVFDLSSLQAQSLGDPSLDTPLTRMRPISAPSAVDQYLQEAPTEAYTARMQFQMPGGAGPPQAGAGLPLASPADSSVIPPPSLGSSWQPGSTWQPGTTMTNTPRSLPANTGLSAPPMLSGTTMLPGRSDLAPVAPPQLSDQFATIDNCSCISPPSSYVAATGWTQVVPAGNLTTTTAPPAYLAPATAVPITSQVIAPPFLPDASAMPKGSGIPRHSLVNFGQNRNPVVVGQGIVGQPVAYVPGQPVRNWIRYFFP